MQKEGTHAGRKAQKSNMMTRVFVTCVLVIQVIIFLLIKGHHADKITFDLLGFFNNHRILLVYLGIINFITFAAFAIDKYKAIKHKTRIRIVVLLGMAFAGGSLGGLIAMYLFKHKTKKNYFTTGIPLMIIMQLLLLFYIMNVGW